MALFKSSTPEKVVQRDIDTANANRERVSTRLAECDQAVTHHMEPAKDCALSGDDAGPAQDRAATLRCLKWRRARRATPDRGSRIRRSLAVPQGPYRQSKAWAFSFLWERSPTATRQGRD